MIISTVGFGNTGASAVLDFLRGYNDLDIVDEFEFQIIQMTDGLLDLKYHLTQNCQRITVNAAIFRFKRLMRTSQVAEYIRARIGGGDLDSLVDEYISNLGVISWDGRSMMDPEDVSIYQVNRWKRNLQRFLWKCKRMINHGSAPRLKKRYFCFISEADFDCVTKDFVSKLLKAMGMDVSKNLVLDMLFSAIRPGAGTEFFDDCKVILVNRDPRDVFSVAKKKYLTDSFAPIDTCEHYAEYYERIRSFFKPDARVLSVQYEDLIYHYYETTERIISFLALKGRPDNEFIYFDPDVSVKYTQRFNEQCSPREVQYITDKLGKWLYPFEAYRQVKVQKEQFFESKGAR